MDLQQILAAFRAATETLKTIAETPGVNALPYASTVANAIRVIQLADGAGVRILEAVNAIKDTFEGKVPTQEELAALDADIAALEAKVDAPLPPKEEGEAE